MSSASVILRPLGTEELGVAVVLLQEALPFDRVDVVAAEKLFGNNGRRVGRTEGAFCRESGRLCGLLAQAGRWIKVLAVAPGERRRGIGTQLLSAAREAGPRPLRSWDHPGNYLSPGLDRRYEAGRAFLCARGFREVGGGLNLRAAVADNPLVTRERAEALAETAGRAGYAVRRVVPADAAALLAMIDREFSPVWSFEVARALEFSPCGVHAAFTSSGEPVAFAAHDGNNRGLGWFGPMGTLPGHRGRGLGEALLIPCLLDVVDRPEGGVIAWVGPVEFYRRACGALSDRQFVVYEEI